MRLNELIITTNQVQVQSIFMNLWLIQDVIPKRKILTKMYRVIEVM